jgi:ribosomal protein L11 methylase PrmA
MNGVEVSVERVDVREEAPPVAPTVVANLTANLLEDCANHLASAGASPRTLVCSGMLATEVDRVTDPFAAIGLRESNRLVEGDWAALLMRLPDLPVGRPGS